MHILKVTVGILFLTVFRWRDFLYCDTKAVFHGRASVLQHCLYSWFVGIRNKAKLRMEAFQQLQMFLCQCCTQRGNSIQSAYLLHLYHVRTTFNDIEHFFPGTHLHGRIQTKKNL